MIVPTLNERGNIASVVDRLSESLKGIDWQVIFVDDDSPDGTSQECRRIAAVNPQVQVIQRIGRRGLASACVEGMLASSAPFVAVMDGDLQHDESLLPRMLETAKATAADIVVGSRNLADGGMGTFASRRVWLSQLGRRLSRYVCSHELSDPMSGFFLVRRTYLDEVVRQLSGVGFKILLDLIASSARPVNVVEVPYVFRERRHGTSKLDVTVGFEYVLLLVDKALGYTIPIQFAAFSLVGAAGVALHLAILGALVSSGLTDFVTAQAIATAAAMISNYFLNNALTYRAAKLKGLRELLQGLAMFCVACSVGALNNVAVAMQLIAYGVPWLAAGAAGIVVGSVWNYSVTAAFTWHVRERRTRTAYRLRKAAEPVKLP